jgi:parallel beta-helix repeat protein
LTIGGVGLAAIFILIAGYLMMIEQQPVIQNPNITQSPLITDNTGINFEIISTPYNYKIIKMSYINNKTITDIQLELLLSMYPPDSPYYVKRQSIQNENVKKFNNEYNTIYIYTGIDNAFHLKYTMPEYSECVDFINGKWEIHVDKKSKNMYTYKFNIEGSKTVMVEENDLFNVLLQSGSPGTTYFISPGLYKERLIISKTSRLIGIGNPVIDAGGAGPDIILSSKNNTIYGLTLINSGNKETYDGGIVITPESNGNRISNNTIYKTIYGIWMYKSSGNIITNNTIRDNDKSGILLLGSRSNIILNNNLYNNINGIKLDILSTYNTIRENNVHNNKEYGIIIDSYKTTNNICEYNIVSSNKMSCSDSVDRTSTPTYTTTVPQTLEEDDWGDCEGNPKCYQS